MSIISLVLGALIFTAVLHAIPFDASLNAINVDPNEPQRFYASSVGGILKSEDRGRTWTQVPIFPSGERQPNIAQVQFDLANPSTLYAYAKGYLSDPLVGIWVSHNQGESWQSITEIDILPREESLDAIFVAPSNGSALYVVTTIGNRYRLYTSSNAGRSWEFVSSWENIANSRILAISPTDEKVVYCSRNGREVHRSDNWGRSWTRIGLMSDSTNSLNSISGFAISPVNPQLIVATMTGPDTTRNGIFRSVNGGGSWQRVRAENSLGVVFSQANPTEVFVRDCCGTASYYSSDAGESFQNVPLGILSVANVTFDPNEAGRLLVAGKGLTRVALPGGGKSTVEGTYTPTAILESRITPAKLLSGDRAEVIDALKLVALEGSSSPGFVATAPTVTSDGFQIEVDANNPEGELTLRRTSRGLSPGRHDTLVEIPVSGAANDTVRFVASLDVAETPEAAGVFLKRLLPLAGRTDVISGLAYREGVLYIGRSGHIQVIHPDGRMETFAGNGDRGYAGDEGPAVDARVGSPRSLAFAPDGTLYFFDDGNGSIRAISPDGVIRTVAGGKTGSFIIQEGAAAHSVRLLTGDLAVLPDGELLIAHSGRVWRLVGGAFRRIYGGGSQAPATGVSATNANFGLTATMKLAVDDEGLLLISVENRIFRVASDNTVVHLAGRISDGVEDAGNPDARERRFAIQAFGSRNGYLYIMDGNSRTLKRVDDSRQMKDVAFNGTHGWMDGCTGALHAPVTFTTNDMAITDEDIVYLAQPGVPMLWLPSETPEGLTTPVVPAEGIVDAAAFGPSMAPGGLISVFGSDVATAQVAAAAMPLPLMLGGGVACVDGQVAPQIFASPLQLNAQVPFGTEPGSRSARFFNAAGGTARVPVEISTAAPEVFRDSNGRGIVVNPDNTLNQTSRGASPGEYVVVYLTGIGEVEPSVGTGIASPSEPVAGVKSEAQVTVGGVPANLYFLGMTPGFVGLSQANVQIPELQPGEHDVVIRIGGKASQAIRITVR